MTQVIYARVPAELKDAAEMYAQERGTSLTTAVTELLDRGLEAVSNSASVAQLEQRIQALTGELQRAQLTVQALEDRERMWQARDQQWASAYAPMVERMQQIVGTCPHCRKPVQGYDLVVAGHCKHCGKSLTPLLDPTTNQATLDRTEFAVFIGAIGVLVGTALQAVQKRLEKGGENA